MVGDDNIHFYGISHHFTADLLLSIESFYFIRHISGPTHIKVQGLPWTLVVCLDLILNSACSEELRVTHHECALFSLSFNLFLCSVNM